MISTKNKLFKNPDELCDFINNNTYVQVVSINNVPTVYQDIDGVNHERTQFVLFYKEEDLD